MPGRLEQTPLPRRDFLGLAGLWTTGIAIFGSILGMMRLPRPSVLPEAARRLRIGQPSEFPPGTTRLIPEHKIMVVANQDGVGAISMVCTHLGCVVTRSEAGFACPCHGSAFDNDGGLTSGPAPRGLRWLQVSQAVDGVVVLNA